MIFRKKYIWVLGALIVIISLVIVKCVLYEGKAQENVENCMEVSIGMTMEQVVDIMGEPNNIKTYQGKINYDDMKITKYYYDAPSGSSVGVNIFFNAQTKKVVRTECKD